MIEKNAKDQDQTLGRQEVSTSGSPTGYAPTNGDFRARGADRLAYECAKAIMRGEVRTRSAIDDALLDYLGVGGIDGPKDVPSWVAEFEADQSA